MAATSDSVQRPGREGRDEVPDKVWLPWRQEGPYLVRPQHLVAKDPDEYALCPVPIGQQVRGLAKATLSEMRPALDPRTFELARQMAARLAEGRPYRLVVREAIRSGRSEQEAREALMALCRAGLVVVFCRNRRRSEACWDVRHAQLTSWGQAVLAPPQADAGGGAGRATGNGSVAPVAGERSAGGRPRQGPRAAGEG